MEGFLDAIITHVRSHKVVTAPHPVTFNVNGVTFWTDIETNRHYLWCGRDPSGFVYQLSASGGYDIHPYYFGEVLSSVDLYRFTDLHKPKTEEALLESLYKNAWAIEQACADKPNFSFEDYMFRAKVVIGWLRYFNSSVTV